MNSWASRNRKFKKFLDHLPEKPGVYEYFDEAGEILYVGKSRNLKSRVSSYFLREPEIPRIRHLVQKIHRIEFIVTDSEVEALILECNLIKQISPKYNVLFKDDKTYPYLKFYLNAEYPYVEKTRKVLADGARYYGPFADEKKLGWLIKFIDDNFQLIKCKKNKSCSSDRGCLEYQIGRCPGACFQKLDKEEYQKSVDKVRAILEGRYGDVLQGLKQKMLECSDALDFEKAALYRDQIKSLSILAQEQVADSSVSASEDYLGFARNHSEYLIQLIAVRNGRIVRQQKFWGDNPDEHEADTLLMRFLQQYYLYIKDPPAVILAESGFNPDEMELFQQSVWKHSGKKILVAQPSQGRRKRILQMAQSNAAESLNVKEHMDKSSGELLLSMKEELELPVVPYRIECFDISNTSGTNPVASMVVCVNGEMKRSDYRKFKIRCKSTPDDFLMMKEAVGRRYSRLKKENAAFPEMILIDGGIGQLHCAAEVIEPLNKDVIIASIAKKEELVFIRGREDCPVQLGESSPVRRLLQRIRDEAHRFAITYHRSLRGKAMLESKLDAVPGIGAVRKRRLLLKFGSIQKIAQASLEQLKDEGVPEQVAEILLGTLKEFLK